MSLAFRVAMGFLMSVFLAFTMSLFLSLIHISKVAQATELVNSLDAEAQALLAEEQAAAARAAAEQAAAEEAARQAQNNNNGYNAPSSNSNNTYVPPVYNNGGGGGGGGSVGNYGSVVDYAMSRIGCPYVWAAEGPDAFDCSGLVRLSLIHIYARSYRT